MKQITAPYPIDKRFNHVCKSMREYSPENWTDLLGVDAGGHWTIRLPSVEVEVFHCPFCGRDLNELFSQWSAGDLWKK